MVPGEEERYPARPVLTALHEGTHQSSESAARLAAPAQNIRITVSGRKKKILLFAKPAIGDILLATPLMRSIRQAEPDAVIDLMCYPGQDAILEGNQDIDNIVIVERRPGFWQLLSMLRRLWRKYDIAITNGADDRVHLYLFFFGRQRVSVTFGDRDAWKRWITFASVVEDDQHALLRNNQLGNLLGYKRLYKLTLPVPAHLRPESLLPQLIACGKSYVVIHPEARLPYKRWTTIGWRTVMRYLSAAGLQVYLTGGGDLEENEYHQELLQAAPPAASSVSGKLSFGETSELIASSCLYIGIDTVNSHIAAAHGVPTIALFGPEKPARWGPWPANYESDAQPWCNEGSQKTGNVLIIQGSGKCETCQQGACFRRRNRGTGCPLMTGITVEQVQDGIRSMLPTDLKP